MSPGVEQQAFVPRKPRSTEMADCREDNAPKGDDGDSCCGGNGGKNILLYACSGGANVAEIADRAARELMFAGEGVMFCLAGLGAGIQGMIQTARDADLNVVIDGCDMDCARKVFDNCGPTNYIWASRRSRAPVRPTIRSRCS